MKTNELISRNLRGCLAQTGRLCVIANQDIEVIQTPLYTLSHVLGRGGCGDLTTHLYINPEKESLVLS